MHTFHNWTKIRIGSYFSWVFFVIIVSGINISIVFHLYQEHSKDIVENENGRTSKNDLEIDTTDNNEEKDYTEAFAKH